MSMTIVAVLSILQGILCSKFTPLACTPLNTVEYLPAVKVFPTPGLPCKRNICPSPLFWIQSAEKAFFASLRAENLCTRASIRNFVSFAKTNLSMAFKSNSGSEAFSMSSVSIYRQSTSLFCFQQPLFPCNKSDKEGQLLTPNP